MTDKTIIGIDPGTNLMGFGVIAVINGKPVYQDMGVIDLRKEPDHFAKLKAVSIKVGELFDRYKPDTLSIESPFVDKNPQVMLKLGRAQGAAITAALLRDMSVYEYAPRKAKVAITGNGSASKEQVCNMIQRILGIQVDVKHLDATDALAIALCHYYDFSSPLGGRKSKSSWEQFLLENPGRINPR